MDIFRWVGLGAGTKTNWQDGRNWEDENGSPYTQARYPGSNTGLYDEVNIDTALADGASSPTTSCDLSAKEALSVLRIGPDFDGTVGASAGYLKAAIATCRIESKLSAEVYLKGIGAGISDLIVTDAGGLYPDGALGNTVLLRGTVALGASTIFGGGATFKLSYISSPGSDVTLDIPSAVTLPDEIVMEGGNITCAAPFDLLKQSDGIWTQTAGDFSEVEQSAGIFNWQGGNVTLAQVSGSFDASIGVKARTVGILVVGPSATANLNNGLSGTITISEYVETWGGIIRWNPGDKIVQT